MTNTSWTRLGFCLHQRPRKQHGNTQNHLHRAPSTARYHPPTAKTRRLLSTRDLSITVPSRIIEAGTDQSRSMMTILWQLIAPERHRLFRQSLRLRPTLTKNRIHHIQRPLKRRFVVLDSWQTVNHYYFNYERFFCCLTGQLSVFILI